MKTLIHRIVLLLFSIALLGTSLSAASFNANGIYYIFHASGMALSAVDGIPNLHTFNAGEAQRFQLVPSGGYYLIKSVAKGKNVGRTGDWDTELTSNANNYSKFTVEDAGGEYVKFRCLDNNLYLGTDSYVPGASLYSDKSGKESLHFWYLREANGTELITDGLNMTINKAEARLSVTKEGDGEGEYPVAARKSLRDAISQAKSVLNAPNSQEEIVEATSALAEAPS